MTQPPVYAPDGRETRCPGRRGDRVCDEPIPDTAIRCPGCIERMAVALRGGADLWPELDATIRRQTRIAAAATRARRDPRPTAGPLCPIDDECTHDSCWQIVRSGINAARVDREEPPIPNEDAGLVNFAAIEVQWAAINTYTAWARVLEEDYGAPIPHDPRPPVKPAPALADLVREKVERCEMTDLMTKPIPMCSCPRHQEPK